MRDIGWKVIASSWAVAGTVLLACCIGLYLAG